MIGASGRSRAARNAVEPDFVQVTMARAWMVWVTSCTAAMIASAVVSSGADCAGHRESADRADRFRRRGDLVHHHHGFNGMVAGRCFGRQHHRIGALKHSGCDVGDFRARRLR